MKSNLRDRNSHFLLPLLALLCITSCSNTEDNSNTESISASTWTINRVVDGDTVWAEDQSGDGYKIRLIGIDAPEANECGFNEATSALQDLIGNKPVVLQSGASSEMDKYGRLLRYVDVSGVDVGLQLIEAGYAIARYDSRDGYGPHSREATYVSADEVSLNFC
jgi:endonuclease YncB( thermonuclease family)